MKDKNQTQKIKVIQQFHDVGKRLREIREYLKKTQADMSVDLGVSLPMLQNYESGKHLISPVGILALAKLGFDLNWLMTGVNRMMVIEGGWEPDIDKNVFRSVISAVWNALEGAGVQLTASGAIQLCEMSYEEYLRAEDDAAFAMKVKQLVSLMQGVRK